MVTTPRALDDLCRALRAAGTFGFDTEFIRERSYVPRLCLVQAAAAGRTALIDPFKVDVRDFWALVLDGRLTKVVHAGSQDLEMCHLATGKAPANIFDVQVAAGLAGLPYPLSYGKLCKEVLGADPLRGHAFSEWSHRPLSRDQVEYAAADVAYLCPMRDRLNARLAELGRTSWLAEEMRPLESERTYAGDANRAVQRVRGWQRMAPRKLALLRELICWREQAARDADVPPRTLVRDEVLLEVLREMPPTVAALAATWGFPRPLARRAGRGVLDALRRGQAAPLDGLPEGGVSRNQEQAEKAAIARLAEAGQERCRQAGLCHDLFASKALYAELLRAIQRGDPNAPAPRLLTGWRKDFAGEILLRAWREGEQ